MLRSTMHRWIIASIFMYWFVYSTTAVLPDRITHCSNGGNSDNLYTTFGYNNGCYKFYRQPKTLQEAQKTCEKDSGGLAKINSR